MNNTVHFIDKLFQVDNLIYGKIMKVERPSRGSIATVTQFYINGTVLQIMDWDSLTNNHPIF